MSEPIDLNLSWEHEGISHDRLVSSEECVSCGDDIDYGVYIIGDTPMGDLLNVDIGTMDIRTDWDSDSGWDWETIPDEVIVCKRCLEHLIEAKTMSEQ